MADTTIEKEKSGGIVQYFREVRGEVRKVTWPSREETIRLTGIVLAVTAVMTVILFAFDWTFSKGLELLVDLFLGVE